MQKNIYQAPTLQLSFFKANDVITASIGDQNESNGGAQNFGG
jgi:hypothetical protein